MSSPTSAPAKRVLGLLENVRSCGRGWSALCPGHDDNRASLSVAEGQDGRVLMKCHAGCDAEEIVGALNLELKDLFMKSPSTLEKNGRRESLTPQLEEEKIYSYRDEVGSLLYQVVRYHGKNFRPRRPGPKGGWIYHLEGVRRVLYNLPDVITATHVVITEGEKDANRTKKALAHFKKWKEVRQWAATACSGGAASWRAEYAPYFAGKCVYILPDNDPPGRKFAHTVARALSAYARRVKIVELPGLPKKGDVSDYLQFHRAEDLQRQLRKAPRYQPKHGQTEHGDNSSFNVESLRDYFDAPEEERTWVVEGMLPAGGMGVMAGKPKAGKSTLARELALAVARGNRFLGRDTQQGNVIYLALEEKRQEVKAHFRDLGATGDEPIWIHCAPAPLAAMEQIRVLLEQHPANLLIIDPLFKFTRVKDGNDYALMTAALEPILTLARNTGTHVMVVHHSRKGERSDAGDSILGSTAILGNVDTALLLCRREQYRTIATRQRYGEDLEETVLEFDPDRRSMRLGANRLQAEKDKLKREILSFLKSNPGAHEAEILDGVVGRRQGKISALRELLGIRVARQGRGGKGDPYRYELSCSPDSHGTEGTTTQDGLQAIESCSNQLPQWSFAALAFGSLAPQNQFEFSGI